MNTYTKLLEQLKFISMGYTENFDNNIQYDNNLINDYYLLNPTANKYVKKIKLDSYIKLFSYFLYKCNNKYNINILHIIKTNKIVQSNIHQIISLCEKWRFGNLYYLFKDNFISKQNINFINLEIYYNNDLYIFDFKNIYNYLYYYINNYSIKQLCFNKVYPIDINDNNYLILIESIYPYCPIIRHVSNPTENDIILYKSNINPFIYGKKIKLNNKVFFYNNCIIGTLYQSEIINDKYYVCFNTYNNNCYFFITTTLYKNKSCKFKKNIIKLTSVEVDDEIFNFKYLLLNRYDTTKFQLVINDNLFIGPSNINSIMTGKKILFDNMKYTLNNYLNINELNTDYMKYFEFYLKRFYNIDDKYKINYDSFKTDILLENNLNFIKDNKYFTCEKMIVKIDEPNINIPEWDWE